MTWILRHWELKLVAAVLAVALWVYTSGQVRVERTITVNAADVQVKGLSGDFQAVRITPAQFQVRLSIPLSRQAEVELDALAPRLELRPDQLQKGVVGFPLTSALLRLTNDIRIEATEPANVQDIEVVLDRIDSGLLPVEPPRIEGLAHGLAAELALDRTLVKVRAASSVLDRLREEGARVRFQDVQMAQIPADLSSPRQERAQLIPLPAPVDAPYTVQQEIAATITVRPHAMVRQSLSLPLAIIATRGLWRSTGIEPAQTRVTVQVRGPANLMAELRPDRDLIAAVHLPDDVPVGGLREVPVRILGPAWLEADPVSATIALSRQED